MAEPRRGIDRGPVMTPTPIPGLSREKTSWIFDGAIQALGGVVPNSTQTHVNRHGTEFEVEISICLRPEDLPAFLRNLDRNATHIKATVDLYGPPRYARGTTDGREAAR